LFFFFFFFLLGPGLRASLLKKEKRRIDHSIASSHFLEAAEVKRSMYHGDAKCWSGIVVYRHGIPVASEEN
jgi:hypothetical protein